jgi:chromosome segregation ATPase
MALSNDINKLNKQIADLAKQLGSGLKIFEENEVKEAQIYLQGLQTEANKLNSELNAVVGIFQSINSELTKGRSTFNQINSASRKLENIAAQILYRRENITKLSVKELKQLQDRSKIEFANLHKTKRSFRINWKTS